LLGKVLRSRHSAFRDLLTALEREVRVPPPLVLDDRRRGSAIIKQADGIIAEIAQRVD